MKKTLSLVLAMLMLLSVFTVTSFGAGSIPVIAGITSTFDGISISWDAVEGAVTYIIYRDDAGIATTTECNYVDVSVKENQTYVYKVGAQTAEGTISVTEVGFDVTYIRPYCAHKEFTEVVDYPATVFGPGLKHKNCNVCKIDFESEEIPMLLPETPTINYLSNGVDGVKVAWNQVDGASSYYVYRRAGGSTEWKGPFITKDTSFLDETAESGVYYKYAVRAFSSAGLSPYNGGKVIKRVATPVKLTVANTPGGIFFRWSKVEGATSYRVYRKLVTDQHWTYLKNVKTTSYADLDVEANTNYVYTVRAISNGVYSNFISSATIRRIETPELNSAKSTREGIYIEFTPVEGVTGYNVYRKVGNGAWTSESYLGSIRTTDSHTYLDRSAKKGVTYTYTVKAYFRDGSSTYVGSYETAGITCKDRY